MTRTSIRAIAVLQRRRAGSEGLKITWIGAGCGPDTLTEAARRALAEAGLVLGAGRLLDALPEGFTSASCRRVAALRPEDVLRELSQAQEAQAVCVLLSGDSGFYSGARRLLPLLNGYEHELLPGISSVQLLSARLGRPWQDWRLCSAHGVDCDAAEELCSGAPCFFLTGGKSGPALLCRRITEAGLGFLPVTVGENLGLAGERIVRGRAETFTETEFAPLNVLLAEAAPRIERRAPGVPDELFERGEGVPMTKREVRAVALALLAPGPKDVCWDVGAGTGSVSVELALQSGSVWAVEQSAEALRLAEKNRETFCAWNLHLVQGRAPECLASLPRPDAVFVGGSGGGLREILRAVHGANPGARICVPAIALESLHAACAELEALGYAVSVTQLSVSRSRAVGALHMMTAQNPVSLVLGEPR